MQKIINRLKGLGVLAVFALLVCLLPSAVVLANSFVDVEMNPQGKGIIVVKDAALQTIGSFDYNTTMSLADGNYTFECTNMDAGYQFWEWELTGSISDNYSDLTSNPISVYVTGAGSVTALVGEGEQPPDTEWVAGDTVLWVSTRAVDQYYQNFEYRAGGSITGDLVGVTPDYEYDDYDRYDTGDCTIALTAVPAEGYEFYRWYIYDGSDKVSTADEYQQGSYWVDDNATIYLEVEDTTGIAVAEVYAEFALTGQSPDIGEDYYVKYQSIVETEGYEHLIPSIGETLDTWQSVDLVTLYDITAPDYTAYYFKRWEISPSAALPGEQSYNNKTLEFYINAQCPYTTVTAVWGYVGTGDVVTVEVVGDGYITPNLEQYTTSYKATYYDLWFADASEVEFMAFPDNGVYFDYWDAVLGTGYNDWENPVMLNSSSQKITVYFSAVPPEYSMLDVDIVIYPAGGGTVELNEVSVTLLDDVEPYDEITLTAVPAEGYVFYGWFGQDIQDSSSLTETFTIINTSDIQAFFTIDPSYEPEPPVLTTTATPETYYRIKVVPFTGDALFEAMMYAGMSNIVTWEVEGTPVEPVRVWDDEAGETYFYVDVLYTNEVTLTARASIARSDYYLLDGAVQYPDIEYALNHWEGDIMATRNAEITFYASRDKEMHLYYSEDTGDEADGGTIIMPSEGFGSLTGRISEWFSGFGIVQDVMYWILVMVGMVVLFVIARDSKLMRVVLPLMLLGLALLVGWVNPWIIALLAMGVGVVVYMATRKVVTGE